MRAERGRRESEGEGLLSAMLATFYSSFAAFPISFLTCHLLKERAILFLKEKMSLGNLSIKN